MLAQRWLGLLLVGALLGVACAEGAGAPRGAPAPSPPGPGGAAPGPDSAAPAAPQALEKVVFALPSVSGNYAPQMLAVQKGYFREEGLDVELPVSRSQLISTGLAAGEIDYAGSFSPSIRNTLAGMPIRLIAGTARGNRWMVVGPGIQSMEQLRDKAIAVTTIGSGTYNAAMLALEHFGIDTETETTWIRAPGTTERLLAIQQDTAQGGAFTSSELPLARSLGLVPLLNLEDIVPLPEGGIATTVRKIETQRDQAKRMTRAILRAIQYIKADREGSLPAFMAVLGVDREEAGQAYDGIVDAFIPDGTVSESSLRFTIEAEKRQLQLTEDVPFSRVVDFSILYEVLAEQGITPAPGSVR
ncbi:MAG TPA: ABC transporter substrate-binding protein [Chloroflexota bacterium]|nr:ABC transporter substrate-binding protein [Chloroflexota bacterium]